MDEIIGVIAKAQQPDGYLATQVTLRDRERFVSNSHHELYTMGHLLTAACAHHRITGKTNLLDVARRVADYVHSAYEDGDAKMINCPYDLPNATVYNETCGQIGNMMWNWRMLLVTGEACFADITMLGTTEASPR